MIKMKIVIDSDALIKLTKSGAKELITEYFDVAIPERVYEETVTEAEGYPDAKEIKRNIEAKRIVAKEAQREEKGEMAVLDLFKRGDYDLLVSDDRRFLKHLAANGIPYLTPPFLIVNLLHKRKISKKCAENYIDNLKMYISEEEYLTAIEEVLKWAK
jgi:rRNA-processing protein FCF1